MMGHNDREVIVQLSPILCHDHSVITLMTLTDKSPFKMYTEVMKKLSKSFYHLWAKRLHRLSPRMKNGDVCLLCHSALIRQVLHHECNFEWRWRAAIWPGQWSHDYPPP
ncbi:hypothetical protein HRbin27_01601 [bacterium HR27]|nr:hypothetical protein HRbin27_01601 [bacterium HR27]